MVLWKKPMVLWKKNCDTIPKAMELRSTTKGKKHGRLPKTQKIWFCNGNNYGNTPKQLKFLIKFVALELWFTMKKL